MKKQYKFIPEKELAKLSTKELRAYRELQRKSRSEKDKLLIKALKKGVMDGVVTK
jgi:hypothetical protein